MASLASAWRRLGRASRQLAVTWTQQRCSRVVGEDVAERGPEPERPVADGEHRGGETPVLERAQHARPSDSVDSR